VTWRARCGPSGELEMTGHSALGTSRAAGPVSDGRDAAVGSGLDRWREQPVAARLHQRSRPDGDLAGGRVREAADEPGRVLEGLHLRHRSLDGRRGRIVCGVGVDTAERHGALGWAPPARTFSDNLPAEHS
jgi:hypothetical protein